jgi:DNA-binding response OmpR family regulator
MQQPSRILIVDDEPVIADTLSVIFRGAGYETLAAYNGVLGLLAAQSFSPNLVLTDVVMPEMDGVSMAMEICSKMPEVRVLLFSGQAGTVNLLQKAEGVGLHFELLHKPVHPKEIIRKVRQLLAGEDGSCQNSASSIQ